MSFRSCIRFCLLLLLAGCQLDEPAKPIARFTVSGNNCAGVPCTVKFTNASENTSIYSWTYLWDFGDGETSEIQNPSHQYSHGGNYTVKFTLSGKYGTATDTTLVVIKGKPAEAPIPNFTITGEKLEVNTEITFTNTSKNATAYVWNFGDKSEDSVSTLFSPKHTFKKEGVYAVKLTATGAGGKATFTNSIVIKPKTMSVKADFGVILDATAIDSTVVTFVNKSVNADKYEWNFGDKKTSALKSPVHKYKKYGIDSSYVIILKAIGAAETFSIKTDTLIIQKN